MLQRLISPANVLHPGRLSRLSSQCAVCHSWPSRQVCSDCVSRFSPTLVRCQSCALALPPDLSMGLRTSPGLCAECIGNPAPLDAMLVAASYAYPWSDLITRYKFGDRPGWASFFAGLMFNAPGIRQALEGLQPGDLIIPMPLSAGRLESRGFNQAWELASALAKLSGSPASADARLLLRTRNTRPQTELKREARLANVKGAFQLDPLRLQVVAGKRVVLVDDVVTSGASIFTAARALRAAGALHVTGMAIAKTQ